MCSVAAKWSHKSSFYPGMSDSGGQGKAGKNVHCSYITEVWTVDGEEMWGDDDNMAKTVQSQVNQNLWLMRHNSDVFVNSKPKMIKLPETYFRSFPQFYSWQYYQL